MKNIVFQVNIQGKRHRPEFDLSTKSWKIWADKNDCEVFVLDQFIEDEQYMKPNWQKWYIFDLLEQSNIDYDQILVVDADTIVHPDCPNFFEETNHEFCVVRNDGCYEWVLRSIKKYKDFLFKDLDVDCWEYFNSGFVILNKKHKPFIKEVLKWYDDNVENINWAEENIKASTEQTPLNFLVKKHGINVKHLSGKYNLQDMFKKNLLWTNNYSWWDDELIFLDAGWVYHFNAIPPVPDERDQSYWIKRTYMELYGKSDNPLDSLLTLQKDKFQHRDTTSREFKEDLIDFFGDKYKDKDVYEVGANIGLTSRVLSFLFKKVYVNNHWTPYKDDSKNDWIVKKELEGGKNFKLYDVDIRNEINYNFNNINYIKMDSYHPEGWPKDLLKDVSVVFIDCIHAYERVYSDVRNAIKLKPEYIVFDDYGLSTMSEVKKAVDEMIENGTLKLEKKIGLSPAEYPIEQEKFEFVDYEGIICSIG